MVTGPIDGNCFGVTRGSEDKRGKRGRIQTRLPPRGREYSLSMRADELQPDLFEPKTFSAFVPIEDDQYLAPQVQSVPDPLCPQNI